MINLRICHGAGIYVLKGCYSDIVIKSNVMGLRLRKSFTWDSIEVRTKFTAKNM